MTRRAAAAAARRPVDVVVFGATGDTGLTACACLYFRGKSLGLKSWAPAARNLRKLESHVMSHLKKSDVGKDGLEPLPPIHADANDDASLNALCRQAKCVISCAGPYALYGEGIVRACVRNACHYVDVTGEVPWVEKMKTKYDAAAKEAGVVLCSFAGYDSVPPNLATYLAADRLREKGEKLKGMEVYFNSRGGAMPTGTINTVVLNVENMKYAVSGGLMGQPPPTKKKTEQEEEGTKTKDTIVPSRARPDLSSSLFWNSLPMYSSMAGKWSAPHIMASINAHTVFSTAVREVSYTTGLFGCAFVYEDQSKYQNLLDFL